MTLNRYHSAGSISEKEVTRTGPFLALILPNRPLLGLVPSHLPTPAMDEKLSLPNLSSALQVTNCLSLTYQIGKGWYAGVLGVHL